MLINGKFLGKEECDASPSKVVLNPYNGLPIGETFECGRQTVDRAISAAEQSYVSWSQTELKARRDLLSNIANNIEKAKEKLAQLLVQEIGKPISLALAEVQRTRLTFELASELLAQEHDEVLELDFDAKGKDFEVFFRRFGIGPLFAITPYNWPYNLAAHKIAPALAAGNSVVLKSSPFSTLSTSYLVETIQNSGCPPGILNFVNCSPENAERACVDNRIKMVSFTGSEEVGWHIKTLVPEKRVTLELGGNATAIVMPDADLAWALSRIVPSAFGYAGQICISTQHILVHESVFEEARDLLIQATKSCSAGDPSNPETVCGPLISMTHVKRIMGIVSKALADGGKLLQGGSPTGLMFEPTLIEIPSDIQPAVFEEVFGPILFLHKFVEIEEAIEFINSSRFGIHSGIFTSENHWRERFFRELDVSGVIFNDAPSIRFDSMPYGGQKRSGFGREGVRFAYEEMTTPKVWLSNRHT